MCSQRIIAPGDSLTVTHPDIAKKALALAMSGSRRGGSVQGMGLKVVVYLLIKTIEEYRPILKKSGHLEGHKLGPHKTIEEHRPIPNKSLVI